MATLRACVAAFVAVLISSCSQPSASVQAPGQTRLPAAPPRSAQKRALMVGVTTFANRSAIAVRELIGPANDVELFRKRVLEPLGVPAANIRTLANVPGAAAPTRANIEREFRRLRDESRSGDEIAILMAGHGSQQPANDDAADDEPDGFDEIFLPSDAGPWDGGRHAVANAVVDDDIRLWITDIRNTGASVWIVFDSCFSGTMTRGAPDSIERERQAEMTSLKVPQAAIDAARKRARPGGAASKTLLGLSSSAGDVVAMYATDMNEKTIEASFAPEMPVQGLFTYEIVQILSRISSPITYRELGRHVLERYRARQRFASTPTFEGAGLDREILGQRTWPDRPQITLNAGASGAGWSIDQGAIHGVTAGSILELFPPAGAAGADRSVGYVKVVTTRPASARVEPAAFGGTPAPRQLMAGSRAKIVYFGPGDQRMRVAFQQPTGEATRAGEAEFVTAGVGSTPPPLERAFSELARRTNGLAERAQGSAADWYVRTVNGEVVLVPAGGWQTAAAPFVACDPADPAKRLTRPDRSRQFAIGPLGDPGLSQRLSDTFLKIGRASNLSRLATSSAPGPRVEFRVTRYDSESATVGRPILSAKDAVVVEDEYLEFAVRNPGERAIDVTMLYVDAGFGITAVFPQVGAEVDNRLAPGQEKVIRSQVTGCPLGWESTVVIAVEAKGPRQSFAMLTQPAVLGTSRGAGDPPPSPLQELLESAAYGRGAETRGPPTPRVVDPYTVKIAAWRTEARP